MWEEPQCTFQSFGEVRISKIISQDSFNRQHIQYGFQRNANYVTYQGLLFLIQSAQRPESGRLTQVFPRFASGPPFPSPPPPPPRAWYSGCILDHPWLLGHQARTNKSLWLAITHLLTTFYQPTNNSQVLLIYQWATYQPTNLINHSPCTYSTNSQHINMSALYGHCRNMSLMSLPLVSVHCHGRVTQQKIKFHKLCKLRFPCIWWTYL